MIATRFIKKLRSFAGDDYKPYWKHLLLAFVVIAAGILVLPAEKWTLEARRAIGGALLATGLVSFLYDYLFVRRVIGGYFELIKAAANLELDRIYIDRGHAMKDIASELQRAHGNVKVACVAGSDFFERGEAAQALADLITWRHNVHVRFLLLKPTSFYARLRAWLEEKYDVNREPQETLDGGCVTPNYARNEFNSSAMRRRLTNARGALKNLYRLTQAPTKLSARFYRYQPSLFIVAVNHWIFVEAYHWGVDRDYSPDPIEPCMAKRVMLLKLRRGSFNGAVFENHFDRLWRCKQSERFLPPQDDSASAPQRSEEGS